MRDNEAWRRISHFLLHALKMYFFTLMFRLDVVLLCCEESEEWMDIIASPANHSEQREPAANSLLISQIELQTPDQLRN